MTKDLIKNFFGLSDEQTERMWINASKIVEKIMSEIEDGNDGDETNSY